MLQASTDDEVLAGVGRRRWREWQMLQAFTDAATPTRHYVDIYLVQVAPLRNILLLLIQLSMAGSYF